jgi:prepilin-type processing-associated H-X9-DG protein
VYGNHESGSPRLLNIYMGYSDPRGEVPIAECPLDLGDSEPNHVAKENCYEQYGTSYLPAFPGHEFAGQLPPASWWRVKNVYGHSENPRIPSVKHNQLTGRTHTKILVGDWPWHANRLWLSEKTRWHGYKGTDAGPDDPDAFRQLNFLFADGRAELFDQMQVREIEDRYTPFWTAADRNWKWW